MGETIGILADRFDGHRIRSITMTTRRCSDPDDLVDAIADMRRRARRAIDRRRREDPRWGTIKIFAVAIPNYTGGEWKADLTGIVHLGQAPEIALEDALVVVAPTRIRPIAAPLMVQDVRQHIVRVISTTAGLREAGIEGVGRWFGAVDRHGGGWRALSWSRGLHRQEAGR